MIPSSSRSLCSDLKSLSLSLKPDQLSKAFNRLALNFWRVPREVDFRHGQCIRHFFEKHVLRSVSSRSSLNVTGQLDLHIILQYFQDRAIALGNADALGPKDISLIFNAYAKIYQNVQQLRGLSVYNTNGLLKVLRQYVTDLIPLARPLVFNMNEQDLSLVLNSISKINVPGDLLLETANEALVSHLREYYEHDQPVRNVYGRLPKFGYNLISELTPQGASLIINCFAKSNISLDRGVINHIVNRFLPSNLEQFSSQQLVTILHGFMKLDVKSSDVRSSLVALDSILATACTEDNMKLLSASLYTFGKYNHFPKASSGKLDLVGNSRPIQCTELELSNIYYGLGKLNLRCESFLERLNICLLDMLHDLTPQGVSTIYHALSRLGFRDSGVVSGLEHSVESRLLSRFLEMVSLLRPSGVRSDFIQSQILPLHLVNISLSAATNLILDNRIFSLLLDSLAQLVGQSMVSSKISKETSGHSGSHAELPTRDASVSRSVDFIHSDLGTQGVYQLYCICQHIMWYASPGLLSHRISTLKTLVHMFTAWESLYRNGSIDRLHGYNDSLESLVDPDVTPSRIQADVVGVLKCILPSSGTLVVEESPAIPYTIDILLYSV
ncbi:uncharacterized protein BBOV_IV004760 [Babesia bovis T2Bo]|uniref:Uncharacterized protein n=1 Tax=Babesia bovis TaxID=5865 RepID=A7AQL8_BABBO|nr:uncharacterized protein BBOV_IV004760 [Babesia bovis T2Bo]EDO06837.1 hypothetical protein BBOV_IV004760 [Babesia bovis T2Bo]|eukprot:XP_001610405.1 hypothetical protein [Babesia bovis T2Bo]